MYSLADPAMTAIFKQIYDTPAYHRLDGHRESDRGQPGQPADTGRSRDRPGHRPGVPGVGGGQRTADRQPAGRAVRHAEPRLADAALPGRRPRPGRPSGLRLRHGAIWPQAPGRAHEPVRQRQADGQRAAAAAGRASAPRRGRRRRGGVPADAGGPDHRDRERRPGLLHRAAHRHRGRRRPGQPAQGRQPGVRQPVAAEPVAAAPAARHARHHGAGAPATRRSWGTCSAWTTSPPACGGTPRAC